MSKDLKVEIKELPIGQLVENKGQIEDVPTNPRKIKRERFNALVESIKASPDMKVLNELKVYPLDGKYVVLGGNHRLQAYKKLGWKTVLCKVLDESTPKERLREIVIKENMQYAENDEKLLAGWDVKELVSWDVPMKINGGGNSQSNEAGEVEFVEVLNEYHNYVVLYFDNEVDWLQAQTLLGLKKVNLMSTSKSSDDVYSKEIGIGRILRGPDVFNRLMKTNAMPSVSDENKEVKE